MVDFPCIFLNPLSLLVVTHAYCKKEMLLVVYKAGNEGLTVGKGRFKTIAFQVLNFQHFLNTCLSEKVHFRSRPLHSLFAVWPCPGR